MSYDYTAPVAVPHYQAAAVAYSTPVTYAHSTPVMYTTPVMSAPRVQQQPREVKKEVPVCAYDVRTVLVPKSVIEDHVVKETRMVAITVPVTVQRTKWITEPRNISIPRPIVEKRVVRKMVPKVIQVEEEYEFDIGVTEMKTFFVGADTSGDGMLSYTEWQAANAAHGYDAATMKQMFVSVPLLIFLPAMPCPKASVLLLVLFRCCSSSMQGLRVRRASAPR